MKGRRKQREMQKRKQMLALVALVVAALVAVAGVAILSRPAEGADGVTVEVKVPADLSAEAVEGAALFKVNCQVCHGVNAAGTKLGPPLIHDIYNPGHHSDQAFYLAAQTGVRQHHWPYGDMPPQPQVSRDEVTKIIGYLRELQEANGIEYKPHRM